MGKMTANSKAIQVTISEALAADPSAFDYDLDNVQLMREEFHTKMTNNFLRGSPHWGVHKELCKIEKVPLTVDKS